MSSGESKSSLRNAPLIDRVEFWAARVIEASTSAETESAGRALAIEAASLAQAVRRLGVQA